ncbi:hypothetical protein LUZ61_008689 [Rhynchospora tenuis]|uniref:Aminotransferase-like plant mobile domain-containing protein n=1 Tax=Rhynchospora tenuis TaxID=198213 RepID=A0AAD5ZW02_9POAL|nr:hypothetical protein LUZ61_008689 [Rhynchospora tenuis]
MDWFPVVHKPMMARTPEVDQHLTTLGLIHVIQLGHMPVDHMLVQGLALFWRPETHTFHFPHVGEMTVSLEDVTFLYGLPTTGRVVTGHCDFDDLELLATYARKHAVRFTKLRKMWKDVDLIPDDEDQIDRYIRDFVLELLGCSLFPDATGDSLPVCYLDLLRDLRNTSSQGVTWTTRPKSKKFKGPAKASRMDYARDVIMKIRPQHIIWGPYDHMRACMPPYAQVDPSLFIVRIPCIHYWMVMWHYADRVMHQFMLYQTVSPPRPELMGYMGTTYRGRDWRQLFESEVGMWGDMARVRVMEERPWSADIEATYLQWLSVMDGIRMFISRFVWQCYDIFISYL